MRRALTIPGYFLLFLVGLLLLPIWLPAMLAWDTVQGSRERPRTRCSLFLLSYLFAECWGMLAAGLVWLLFYRGGRERYRAINYRLQ